MALPHQAQYSSFLFVHVFICALCSCNLYAFYATLTLLCMLHQELLSLFVRLNFRSRQSGKKLNYCLLQFAVSQQNSVGRNLCLFTTPPSLCYFEPPTK